MSYTTSIILIFSIVIYSLTIQVQAEIDSATIQNEYIASFDDDKASLSLSVPSFALDNRWLAFTESNYWENVPVDILSNLDVTSAMAFYESLNLDNLVKYNIAEAQKLLKKNLIDSKRGEAIAEEKEDIQIVDRTKNNVFLYSSDFNEDLEEMMTGKLIQIGSIEDEDYYDMHHHNKRNNTSNFPREKNSKLKHILRNILYLHSNNGNEGYDVHIINSGNVKDYLPDISIEFFLTWAPEEQLNYVAVSIICKYGGIWIN